MELNKLRDVDNSIKQTKLLAILFAVTLLVGFIVSLVYLSNKIDQAYTKTMVLDKQGNAYAVNEMDANETRMIEYEAHVKLFYQKWYSFDEYTYTKNITEALELIGDAGKELLNEYNDINVLNTMMQKNISYTVSITDIKINMNTIPISGTIKGIQTGHRARGEISRGINVNFTLTDKGISRSRKNLHGCKIETWDVTYTNTFTDGEEEN